MTNIGLFVVVFFFLFRFDFSSVHLSIIKWRNRLKRKYWKSNGLSLICRFEVMIQNNYKYFALQQQYPDNEQKYLTDDAFSDVGRKHFEYQRLKLTFKCKQQWFLTTMHCNLSPCVFCSANNQNLWNMFSDFYSLLINIFSMPFIETKTFD